MMVGGICGVSTYFPQMCSRITNPINERLKTSATVGPLILKRKRGEKERRREEGIRDMCVSEDGRRYIHLKSSCVILKSKAESTAGTCRCSWS